MSGPTCTSTRTGRVGFKSEILPDPAQDAAEYLRAAYAHPAWLVRRWLECYDQRVVREICVADNARPPLTVRPNTLRCSCEQLLQRFVEAGLDAKEAGAAVQLAGSAAPRELPGYGEGWFTVQGPTAMAAAPLLGPRVGERVLDLCAAPGGKTTHLAELMSNAGAVIACDVSGDKLDRVDENCRRLGISIVQTHLVEELSHLVAAGGRFDAVLVDVPCSNTGVLARRAEVRHRLRPEMFGPLVQQQTELLERAVSVVKAGAAVLYSTCSIEPVENQLVIEKFLRDRDNVTLQTEQLTLPSQWADGGYVALLRVN